MRGNSSGSKKLPWKKRLTSFLRQPNSFPAIEKTELEVRFLERWSDRNVENLLADESSAYLLHLRTIADGRWMNDEWDDLFDEEYKLGDSNYDKTIQLCHEVGGVLRDHGPISISRIIQKLQSRNVIREVEDLSYNSAAHRLVFALLGWLSLLYIPGIRHDSDELRINLKATQSFIKGSVPGELIGRPLDELLNSFGALLPRPQENRRDELSGSQSSQAQLNPPGFKLEVSYMNVATLKDMANMQIIWVDSLSEHLQFDPATPSVSLFKCPSFCKLQKQSDQSALAVILREFYPLDENPAAEKFTVAQLLNEVMLSYSLLFKADRRARKVYQRHERTRAALGTTSTIADFTKGAHGNEIIVVDPCLDELCGNSIPSSVNPGAAVRESYDANIEFPILKARLERIQHYIRDIQPNRLMSLWRDQRDLRLWYTIWAVIILTVIGLIIAAVSMFLAAVQVNLARLAYELQLDQGTA